MTLPDLMRQLAQGEGQRLEFKQDAIKPGDLAETLVALANARGGMVILGVDDAGVPCGVQSYKQAYDLAMTAASQELCDPPIPLADIEPVAVAQGIQVLVVTVPRSRQLHATHGRFLVRRGSRNISLTTAEIADRTRRLSSAGLGILPLTSGYQALYEVSRFEASLELCDGRGDLALLQREQDLRFIQDGVVGVYHQVWGDGQLFDEYEVEPGVVADRFQFGSRSITLISLREVKSRGDHLRLWIRRRIKRGWTQAEEWLELAVSHQTRILRARVIFPLERSPSRATIIEESTGSARELEKRRWQLDSRGRTILTWQKRNPALGETYILRWSW